MNIEVINGLSVDIVHVNADNQLNLLQLCDVTASDYEHLDIHSIYAIEGYYNYHMINNDIQN